MADYYDHDYPPPPKPKHCGSAEPHGTHTHRPTWGDKYVCTGNLSSADQKR